LSPQLPQRTRAVAAAILLMAAAFIVTKTGRDALYLQGDGLYGLPKAYLGIAVLSVPLALGMLAAIRRFGPRATRVMAPLGMAALLLGFHRLAAPGAGPVMTAFFMLVPLAFGVLFSVAWLLAADLLEGAPRPLLARAYGIIGAASIAGSLAGAAVARCLAPRIEPRGLLLVGAGLLLASSATMAAAHASFPPSRGSADPASSAHGELRPLLRQRQLLLLLLVGMLASLSATLVDFQFYLAAATSGRDPRASAAFFANTYLVLSGAALLLQIYAMPALQRVLGVHGSLLVLPGTLFAGAAGLLWGGSLLTRSALRVTDGGIRASIHRVNWEQAYLALPRSRRTMAKVMVDGAGARVAEGLAALMLWIWLQGVVAGGSLAGRNTSWVTWALFAALALWLLLTRVLGRSLGTSAPAEDPPSAIPLPDT